MFVYLSKKIAIPNNFKLYSVAWNHDQGWIACGGEHGLVKVLKMDSAEGANVGKPGAPSQPRSALSMNQTLEGHKGNVRALAWNEGFSRLTTSDDNGLIIVWMIHKGMWFEEMINNKEDSIVTDMRWASDGSRICIIYRDGNVIVGGVDGTRVWSSDIDHELEFCSWSPDGQTLLFGTSESEVLAYDQNGNFVSPLRLFAIDDTPNVKIADIDWYDELHGLIASDAPGLAIAFENGRLQFMRDVNDEVPILVDTGLEVVCCRWSPHGTSLAVAGHQQVTVKTAQGGEGKRKLNMVQFYNPFGEHLKTLRVPGSSIESLSWEGSGLRMSLAVDSFIFSANVRPDYKWGFFAGTLVYAFRKTGRAEDAVMFWNSNTPESKQLKFVKNLVHIAAAGDNALLVARIEDSSTSEQHALILCNSIGVPVDSRTIELIPVCVGMSKSHIVVCGTNYVYVWHYRSRKSTLTAAEGVGASVRRAQGREAMFHIDDVPEAGQLPDLDAAELRKAVGQMVTNDCISSVTVGEGCFVVGRESGTVHRYSLPVMMLDNKIILPGRPQTMSLNCDDTRLAAVDINGSMTLWDVRKKVVALEGQETFPGADQLPFDRKDVWDMVWSSDTPDIFAVVEKTRMYIYRGSKAEEPVVNPGYPCEFKDLTVSVALFDEIMDSPEKPDPSLIRNFEVKSLRDARGILQSVSIAEAYQFIQDNPHPRLWRILAEHALEKLDFDKADIAFVQCGDYRGIQLVKRLKMIDDEAKQKAEVCVYFKKFSEAEEIYIDIDRRDLAIQLRQRLGDWHRVLQLAEQGGGDDDLIRKAENEIGNYYADRQKWAEAEEYFVRGKNYKRLIQCYYALEKYNALENLVAALPQGDPLLIEVGENLASVGLIESSTKAFMRAGDVQAAVDACVLTHNWDRAVSLARKNKVSGFEKPLAAYARQLLEDKRILQAVDLYRKAYMHLEAARLLINLGKDSMKERKLLLSKKYFVFAAQEVDAHRKNVLAQSEEQSTAKTLETLLSHETRMDVDPELSDAWKHAEAVHFMLLAQRFLYRGEYAGAMGAALRLKTYDHLVDPKEAFSLLTLAALRNQHYGQASRALMRLETDDSLTQEERDKFEAVSMKLFRDHDPVDPEPVTERCPVCANDVPEWSSTCRDCSTKFPVCVATGRALLGRDVSCKRCRHKIDEGTAKALRTCPLCHEALR